MMITVYGAGYVGLVTAVCLAKLGHHVVCADINAARIEQLQQGRCYLEEKNLPTLLQEQLVSERLQFTTDLEYAVQFSTLHMVATGTPSLSDGQADLRQVLAVIDTIAQSATEGGTIVIKSTVPVGTGDAIAHHVTTALVRHNKQYRFSVTSNPEFLREGCAVDDFLHADRIVLGGEQESLAPLKALYEPLAKQGVPLLSMGRRSAELTKYTANAMLAMRVSFINQMSQLAERVGANIDEIKGGIGLDPRIGPQFLDAGIGYGGSCFPKDVRALIHTAEDLGIDTSLLRAVENVNQGQKNWVFDKLTCHFGPSLGNKTVGIWGLAFKPGTDDMREASSLVIIHALLREGVKLRLYDPNAMSNARQLVRSDAIQWCNSAQEVVSCGLDALVIATEWDEFKHFPLDRLKHYVDQSPVMDGRNCYELAAIAAAQITYYSVGRPLVSPGDLNHSLFSVGNVKLPLKDVHAN